MELHLHDVTVVSDHVEGLHGFYEQVLGLEMPALPPVIVHVGHDEDTPEADSAGTVIEIHPLLGRRPGGETAPLAPPRRGAR